jgi:putative intracellular protease/amidase
MQSVAIEVSDTDFDPTEVVEPWRVLTEAGYNVVFATGSGQPGACDPLLLTGVLFGQLGAKPEAVALYEKLLKSQEFQNPCRYEALSPEAQKGLLLPGGHAKGMRGYLESKALQERVAAFFAAARPVGAICHGPVVLARTHDPKTGKSVINGRTVTSLPKHLEGSAWAISAWKLGDYYRTYPVWVQDEVCAALGEKGSYKAGPLLARYSDPFVVRDQKLVTARWPGDAKLFAKTFLEVLKEA